MNASEMVTATNSCSPSSAAIFDCAALLSFLHDDAFGASSSNARGCRCSLLSSCSGELAVAAVLALAAAN